MSLSHVGTYEVETNPRDTSKAKRSFCNLTMTPQELVTVPDLVDKETTALPDQTTSTGTPAVPNLCPGPDKVEKPSTSDVSSALTAAYFSIAVLSLVVTAQVGILIVIIWILLPCYLQYKTSKDEHRPHDTSTVRYHSCPSADNLSSTLDDPQTEQRQVLVNVIPEHQDQADFHIHTPETDPEPTQPSRERHRLNNPGARQEMPPGSSVN